MDYLLYNWFYKLATNSHRGKWDPQGQGYGEPQILKETPVSQVSLEA